MAVKENLSQIASHLHPIDHHFSMQGNMSAVFTSVANITSLQFLDLSGDTAITGSLENGTASEAVCKAVKVTHPSWDFAAETAALFAG